MGLSLKFLRVLKKSLTEFNKRLIRSMVKMAPKISNMEANGSWSRGKEFSDWGRKPMRRKSGGNRERVSGILFLTKKSSNFDFVLLETFKKISLKIRLLTIQKIKANSPMMTPKVMASKSLAIAGLIPKRS
jgi:hypothetical protein